MIQADRLDDAKKAFAECGDVVEKFSGDKDLLFRFYKAEGDLREKQGDPEVAKSRYREAMSQRESILAELKDPELAESYRNRPEMKEVSDALEKL